jgi:hypothetical protein
MIKSIFDLKIPDDYNLFTKGISQSLLGSFQNCRRKFLFEINRFQSPDIERKTTYGTMVHDLLEKIYIAFYRNKISWEDLTKMTLINIENYKLPNLFNQNDIELMKAKAQAMLEEYLIFYKTDFVNLKFEEIEKVFSVNFKGYILRGKKDGKIYDKNNGLWNIEHKNFSKIVDELPDLLTYDFQNLFYLVADNCEKRKDIIGVKYNVLRNPDVRKMVNPEEVYNHLKDLIKKDQRHYFIRYEIPYSRGKVKNFSFELWNKLNDLQEIIDIDDKKQQFFRLYKNEKACNSPYKCDFQQACSTCNLVGYKQKDKLFNELESSKKAIKIQ